MLTQRQRQLLAMIDAYQRRHGVPPSYDEMRVTLGLKSKSGIHRLVLALTERGHLRRLPHRARAIELTRPAVAVNEQAAANPRPANVVRPSFRPTVVKPPASGVRSAPPGVVDVPVCGRIAAGTPIEALTERDRQASVPATWLAAGAEHFALEVVGDSMEGLGILDGDVVLVRRTEDAANGAVVVALIDDQEATLKRLRRRNNTVALEAANPRYETRIYGADRIKIQGVLAGLLRRYA